MIKEIELIEFLKTGNIGDGKIIHYGMTRNGLIEALGKTKWIHYRSRNSRYPLIYKYGKIEFYFEEGEKGRLYGIQVKPTIQEAESKDLKIDYGFIKPELSFETSLNHLESASINYEIIEQDDDREEIQIVETEGKVQLMFSEDCDQSLIIDKVNKFVGFDLDEFRQNKKNVKNQNPLIDN